MIDPKKVNVRKSLATGWLEGKFSHLHFIETIVWIAIHSGFFLVSLYLIYRSLEFPSLRVLTLVGCCLALFTAFGVFRAITRTKLYKIDTMMLTKDIKETLINYYKSINEIIEHESGDLLIIHDPG